MKLIINIIKPLSISLIILFITTWIINKINKSNKTNQSINSIECGFNHLINKNLPLSINFVLIIIIFILFDIEIIILLPNIVINSKTQWSLNFLLFIIISLIYEIKNNKINWIK
ncbi:MAG: NADH-quinone oxidoreductase subunit A [Spiroplasma ixodetis]|nr:NADH-quinone oxidoreductase subunit A [Spiroplasma ixodetis]